MCTDDTAVDEAEQIISSSPLPRDLKPEMGNAVELQRLTREAIASLNAPTMSNARMEMNAGVYS